MSGAIAATIWFHAGISCVWKTLTRYCQTGVNEADRKLHSCCSLLQSPDQKPVLEAIADEVCVSHVTTGPSTCPIALIAFSNPCVRASQSENRVITCEIQDIRLPSIGSNA